MSLKVFGLEGVARGTVAIAGLIGLLITLAPSAVIGLVVYKGLQHGAERIDQGFARLEGAVKGTDGDRQVVRDALVDLRGEARLLREQYTALAESQKSVACASWYGPEEKRAVRLKFEHNPSVEKELKKLYCP